MKEHNFVRSKGEDKYAEVIFCAKCGYLVWNFGYGADWNVKELQSKLPFTCNGDK